MNKILFLIIILFSATYIYSQNVDFTKKNFPNDKVKLNKAVDNIFDGDDNYEDELYVNAIGYFLKANNFNPNNAFLNYKIGVCYLHSITKEKAETYFKKSYLLDAKVTKDILFKLAYSYQLTYKFEEAKEQFIIYERSLGSSNYDQKQKVIAKKHIVECENGIKLMANPTKGEVIGLDIINTQYSEYSPLINADESLLIFTSRRKNTTGGQKDPYDLRYYEDVYYSKNKEGWQQPQGIGTPINTLSHEAIVGLSPDGQKLFLYRGDKSGKGDIYECTLNGRKWSKPKKLPEPINTKSHETSASISFDGRTLYFVSDREEGKGKKDIYVSVKSSKGVWGKPKNIEQLNTEFDEDGVFIHPNGKSLYFSSKGHNTMGGYDIFISELNEKGEWSVPKNIGYPINSPDDDIFFVMSADAQRGYFTSSKTGGKGEKDIYMIDFTKEESLQSGALLTIVKGSVMDAELKTPVFAKVEITDNVSGEIIADFTSNKETGEYLISLPSGKNYVINVNAEKYLFHSENFFLSDTSNYKESVINIDLFSLRLGSKTILKNIFFDFASDSLYEESHAELDRVVDLMKKNTSMKLEISGHTDDISSLETNKKLSQARARIVYKYIKSKGISKRRLKYKGQAFFYPIASNKTEEGRKQNRRVEIKIIKE